MKTSNFLSLNWTDVGKGILVAAGGALLIGLQNALTTGVFDYKAIGLTALAAGVSYLVKNFFTPASVVTPVDPAK